jgi:hypothetical protein
VPSGGLASDYELVEVEGSFGMVLICPEVPIHGASTHGAQDLAGVDDDPGTLLIDRCSLMPCRHTHRDLIPVLGPDEPNGCEDAARCCHVARFHEERPGD